METQPPRSKFRQFLARPPMRLALLALFALLLASAAVWLMERSLRSPRNRRAVQSWLDERLNADVSNMGDMRIRLNLIHKSRLVVGNVEVEHPNPLFAGKLAVITRMSAAAAPWSVARVWPGTLELHLRDADFLLEENEAGEWSTDGLLSPSSAPDQRFPFPVPKVSTIEALFEDVAFEVRRHGYGLKVNVDGHAFGRADSPAVTLQANMAPFSFRDLATGAAVAGTAGPAAVRFLFDREKGGLPRPVPGSCEVKVSGLPVASLPFFIAGIPLENASGSFNGLISYQEHDAGAGAVYLNGALTDAPLGVFGLPPQAALRVTWPIAPLHADAQAQLHIGPSGFSAFEVTIPLDGKGNPELLSMRGNVAALDSVPEMFTRHSRWLDWLSRSFPSIEWRAATWRGFGWEGGNMLLRLYRSTGGLNLTGETEMMGGRVRIAMTPDQHDAPIAIAAEKLDAQFMAFKLSQMLPEAFRAHLTGTHVNLTWRGFQSPEGDINEWGTGLVFAKPVIDIAASGAWWRSLPGVSRAVAEALPDWGGGDDGELLEIAKQTIIRFDQLSIVSEKDPNGDLAVEFRAYGDAVGQTTGMVEKRPNGLIEGEFLLAGPSVLIDAATKANPALGNALALLANDSMGLRVAFRIEPGREPAFTFPFLADARRVHDDMTGDGAERP